MAAVKNGDVIGHDEALSVLDTWGQQEDAA